jgi:hypothetical protein
VVRDSSGNTIEFLGTAEAGFASGTGGMIVRNTNEIGAVYHEGTFRNGLPDGVVLLEEPGKKPRIREFRAGLDVGKGDESQLKRLVF